MGCFVNPIDSLLRREPFKRFYSLSEAGYTADDFPVSNLDAVRTMTADYKSQMVRLMSPRFRVPALRRAAFGPVINLDEALDGVPECYRRRQTARPAPLRIGINLSRAWDSAECTAIRGAAILALIDLCRMRGQATRLELAYGNGVKLRYRGSDARPCHVRIGLPAITPDMLTRVCCSSNAITAVGERYVSTLGHRWVGYYRFHEWEREWRTKEYDFVLDRIETSDLETEKARVMNQLEQFGVLGKQNA